MEELLTISQTALSELQEINENLAKADNRKDPESQTSKKNTALRRYLLQIFLDVIHSLQNQSVQRN